MLLSLMNVTGERTDAVLLAIGGSRMRVVIRGLNDAAELRFIKDQWIFENGVAVEIESLIPISTATLESGKPLRTMTAAF